MKQLISKLHPGYLWFIFMGLVICLTFLFGDAGRESLEYHHSKIIAGELWRLITGHLVHSNLWHLILNLASLTLIATLFGTLLNFKQWFFGFLFSGLFVSACYIVISPQFESYVGLSAVLYGAIIIGALLDLGKNIWIAVALLVIVTGRVIWQQFDGASIELAEMVGTRVAIESHLYGIISGYLYGLTMCIKLHRQHRPDT